MKKKLKYKEVYFFDNANNNNLLCINFDRIACNCFFILTIFILIICNSRGQDGNPNPVIGREMHGTLLSFH